MKPEENKPKRQKFKTYPMGYFHIDIAQLHTQEGKLYMFVAIDRTSKFALVELVSSADKMQAAAFLNRLIETVPYKIHTILDDNGIQFTNRKKDELAFEHIFTRTCREHSIDHRLTQINHPWTNGQVERMNRTINRLLKYYSSNAAYPPSDFWRLQNLANFLTIFRKNHQNHRKISQISSIFSNF